ncbi:serine hydrolase domain-containing protein [Chondromyces crocatus]|uniref:Beta-lactamase-related domain-containing protein n=1 Tax=Chondromyces crocatus TaxID=52 RepID=A0A0K1E8C6_CHOCO|nr:serine hydrolase domain-containing protein [Chondromyces crocatus]AKT36947.1 uncharacterized protein CMC5_010680 [Chondromyces crocatus]
MNAPATRRRAFSSTRLGASNTRLGAAIMRLGAAVVLLAACAAPPVASRKTSPAEPPPPAQGATVDARVPTSTSPPLPSSAPSSLPQGDPAAEGLDPTRLADLVARAEATSSDALVILRNGKLVGAWTFGEPRSPIELMSVTKSIVSLAIGLLIDEGKIASVDAPVHHFFPEWNQGQKKDITVRHLLEHTSGLQHEPSTNVIYASPDFVRQALAAELTHPPGTRWSYNNKAVNLLAGVVHVASGEKLDDYLKRKLFLPLGIQESSWERDRAGNPHGMSGLGLHAVDLARIGQLLLDGGVWNGKRVLSEGWIDTSTAWARERGESGMLWWPVLDWMKFSIDGELVAQWRKAKIDGALLRKLIPLQDRTFDSRRAFEEALSGALGPEGVSALQASTSKAGLRTKKVQLGPTIGYAGDGWLGQFLVVLPAAKLVAVRQRRYPASEAEVNDPDRRFPDFIEKVRALPR